MGFEIERKFLVDGISKVPVGDAYRITQGYLNLDPERTVRVRIYSKPGDDQRGSSGVITIKGKSTPDGLARPEWEYEIPVNDAWEMIKLCTGVIDKTRYNTWHESRLWEIDVFHGDNDGLVVAEIELNSVLEIELTSVSKGFIVPPWIGTEVTGDPKYYNSNLIKLPYKDW